MYTRKELIGLCEAWEKKKLRAIDDPAGYSLYWYHKQRLGEPVIREKKSPEEIKRRIRIYNTAYQRRRRARLKMEKKGRG